MSHALGGLAGKWRHGHHLESNLPHKNNKKLTYRRETARQLHASFSARSLIAHFT